MFYADFVLSKKGPLSQVWLAAHWEKKLSKAQIVDTDVDAAVNEMMRPSQGLALRTTGHLLLGICRVFSRKTKYLLADTNEAFLKIKLVFRSGALDEPNPVFPTFSNQDIYGDFGDNILPEFDDEDLNHAPICQSRIDDITMKEDLNPLGGSYNYNEVLEDDDFGEIAAGVQPEDYLRLMQEMEEMAGKDEPQEKPAEDEEDTSETNNSSMFGRERESTPALSESHAPGSAIFQDDDFSGAHHDDERLEEDDRNFQSTSGSRDMPIEEMDYDDQVFRPTSPFKEDTAYRSETPRATSPTPSVAPSTNTHEDPDTIEKFYEKHAQKRAMAEKQTVKKRKMDDVRMITGEEMKANMADYRELLVHLDLAPPTRKLMINKRRSHAEFLLHFPGMIGFSRNKQYIRDYQSLLTVKKQEDDEERKEAIKNALGLWEIGEADLQQQQHEMEMSISREDPIYDDDFDAASTLDFNSYDDFDMPPMQDMELNKDEPERNPLSPFAPMIDDEESSPSEKRRKMTEEKDEKDELDDSAIDEDNRWSKRTQGMLHTIASKLEHTSLGQIELDEVLKKGTSRKVAAQKFYSILCLKKNQCIDVEQKEPFGDIIIKAGPNINANLL